MKPCGIRCRAAAWGADLMPESKMRFLTSAVSLAQWKKCFWLLIYFSYPRIYLSQKWNTGSFAAGVCAVSGSARRAALSMLNHCISETPWCWGANRLHIHKVMGFFEKQSHFVTLKSAHLMPWSYCVPVSLSLGNPPAFASGLGVWQGKPCCDTGGVNLLLLFCTQSTDSKLIPALFSGFTASEVLLYLSRLHLIPLSGADDAFPHLPGLYKGLNISCRGVHIALLWPLRGCSSPWKGRRALLNSYFAGWILHNPCWELVKAAEPWWVV